MQDIAIAQDKETELSAKVAGALAEAQAFEITCNEDYQEAGRRRDGLKALDSFVGELLDGPREAAHKLWKGLVAKREAFLGPIEDARKAYKKSMFKWEDKLEAERRAKEDRLRLEAQKKAEDEAIAAAALAEKDGNAAEAQAILAAPIQAPAVIVEKELPKLKGHTRRTVFKYRFTDKTKVKPAYLIPNEVGIGSTVRNLGKAAEAQIGGIEVYEESV